MSKTVNEIGRLNNNNKIVLIILCAYMKNIQPVHILNLLIITSDNKLNVIISKYRLYEKKKKKTKRILIRYISTHFM